MNKYPKFIVVLLVLPLFLISCDDNDNSSEGRARGKMDNRMYMQRHEMHKLRDDAILTRQVKNPIKTCLQS